MNLSQSRAHPKRFRVAKNVVHISCVLVLVVALLISVSGCGNLQKNLQNGPTKTITDCVGRTVEIPAEPQRVACLWASVAHMMAALGVGEKMVGVPKGIKTDVMMGTLYPQIKELSLPYEGGHINIEELARTKTDLAIMREETWLNKSEVEKLENAGIPFVVVSYDSIDSLRNAISVMGEVFTKEDRAQEYIDHIDNTLALVDERVASVPNEQRPTVYHSLNEAIRTNTGDDICSEIMGRAGVISASSEHDVRVSEEGVYLTLEELYLWDPDAIIANEYSVTDYVLTDQKWAELKAVKEGKVYTLPVGLTRWCHFGSIEPQMAVLAIAKDFYPELMADIDMEAYVKEYYDSQFDLELDDTTVKDILTGTGMRKPNKPN